MNNSHQPNLSVNASVSVISRGIVQIVVESCIFVILDITALVGNVLVCLAWYRNPSLRTVTNIFILSLALTDLLMAVLVFPPTMASSITNNFVGGDYAYAVRGIGANILGGTSALTVMLLAINRYFRVVKPAHYPNLYSKKRSTVMAVSAWIVTALMVSVCYPLVGIRYGFHPANPTLMFPEFLNASAYIVFVVGYSVYIAVPSAIIATCYVKIYQTIRQHNTGGALSSQGRHSPYGVEEAKLTRLLTVVVVGFHLCWLPPFVTVIVGTLNVIGETGLKYFNFYCTFPVFASSVINPIIYGTMSQTFRKEFLKILRGL